MCRYNINRSIEETERTTQTGRESPLDPNGAQLVDFKLYSVRYYVLQLMRCGISSRELTATGDIQPYWSRLLTTIFL